MPRRQSIDEEKLKEAYQAWKLGISLRKLEKKYGVSKSELHREFMKMEEKELAENTVELISKEEDKQSEAVDADPELKKEMSEVRELNKRIEIATKHISLKEEKKELKRQALALEAQLDPSKLLDYFDKVTAEDDPHLVRKLEEHCPKLGITVKEGIDEAFDETFDKWSKHQWRDVTFRDYVKYNLQEWFSANEMWFEEEKNRIEMEKAKRLEESLSRIESTLKCPSCKEQGRLVRQRIVKESFRQLPTVWYRCSDCHFFYKLWLKYGKDGYYDGKLSSTRFARIILLNEILK